MKIGIIGEGSGLLVTSNLLLQIVTELNSIIVDICATQPGSRLSEIDLVCGGEYWIIPVAATFFNAGPYRWLKVYFDFVIPGTVDNNGRMTQEEIDTCPALKEATKKGLCDEYGNRTLNRLKLIRDVDYIISFKYGSNCPSGNNAKNTVHVSLTKLAGITSLELAKIINKLRT